MSAEAKGRRRLLGIGSLLMDLIAEVEDNFLEKYVTGEKGGMAMLDDSEQHAILDELRIPPRRVPGGAAANTIFALAQLGQECSMLGKLGQDENGSFYRARLEQAGIGVETLFSTSKRATGTCLSLVTPDAERTMRTYLGASQLLSINEVESVDFNQYGFVLIEGYLLYSPVFPSVMRCAKAAGCRIGLDLGSFELVRAFQGDLPGILKEYVDVVLANEEEATALLPEISTEERLSILASWCEVVALKLGRRGCVVRSRSEEAKVPALVVEHPLDTTAAGDLWAAGFLFGLLRNKPLALAAWYGSLIAHEVVKVLGSELPEEVWVEIRHRMKLEER